MQANSFVNKCRVFGKKRLEISNTCKSSEDWQSLWVASEYPFNFKAGACWTFTVEYKVADFEAELGFFIDILGLDSNALDTEYAMIMEPEGKYYFSIVKTSPEKVTPVDAIRLEFMLDDIKKVSEELINRGIEFEQVPKPYGEGSPMYRGTLRTPNGIQIALWGFVKNE